MSQNGVFAGERAIQIIRLFVIQLKGYQKKCITFIPFPNISKNEIFHCSNLLGRDVIIIMSSPPQNVLEQLEKCPKSVSRSHQFAHVYRVIKSDWLTRTNINYNFKIFFVEEK